MKWKFWKTVADMAPAAIDIATASGAPITKDLSEAIKAAAKAGGSGLVRHNRAMEDTFASVSTFLDDMEKQEGKRIPMSVRIEYQRAMLDAQYKVLKAIGVVSKP